MKKTLLCLAVVVFHFACASGSAPGEKGADGAQGPAGEQGPTGPAGAAGAFTGSCPAGFPLLGVSATNEPLCDHSIVTASAADTHFSGYGVETPDGNFLSILTQSGPNRVLYKCTNKSCSATSFEGYTSALRIAFDSGLRVTLDNPSATPRLLSITRCTTADCSTKATTSTQIADFLNLSFFFVGSNGLPLIVYEPTGAPGINIHSCSNASCTSGTTTTVTSIRDVQTVMRLDGRLLFFYLDSATRTASVYDCADAQCSSGTARALGSSGDDFVIAAVGPNGIPVFTTAIISLRSASFHLCSDANCSSASSVALPVYGGGNLAVRPNNLASLTTVDGRLLSCSSPSCDTSTLEDAANGPLTFTSDGRAIISDALTRRLLICLKSTCAH